VPAPLVEQLERTHSNPSADRRVTVRLPGDGERVAVRPVSHRAHAHRAAPAAARVLDRSAGGLALGLPRPMEAGSILWVELPRGAGESDWYLAQARHCRQAGNEWVAGCEFVGERPAC